MMASLRLGVRLALRAGRTRILTVAVCAALGVLLLLFSLDLPYALHASNSRVARTDKIAYLVLSGVVAAPVAVMVLTVSRLSSASRDRRLSTLRLMGMARFEATVVAVVETTLLAAVGASAGLVAWLLLRASFLRRLVDMGWTASIPPAHLSWAVIATLTLTLVAAASSVAPALRSSRSALADSRTVRPARHLWWPLALLALAMATGLIATARQSAQSQGSPSVLPLAICFFGCIIALVAAGPALTAAVGRALRRLPGPLPTLAGRRMEADRSATSRALAGLVLSTFAAAFGLSVFTIFTTTPQYREARWAMGHTRVEVNTAYDGASVPNLIEQARRTPGVVSVVPTWGTTYSTDNPPVVVSPCAQLRTIAVVTGCRDDAAWVARDPQGRNTTLPTAKIHGHQVSAVSAGTVRFFDFAAGGYGPGWFPSYGDTVVVPPSVMQRAKIAPDAVALTVAPGGRFGSSSLLFDGQDWENYDNVAVYRTMTYTLIACVVAVGLFTVVVNVIDRAAERRRAVTATRVIGTPVRVLRRAQFLGVFLPLFGAVTLATAAGWVTGRTYLSFGDALGSFPASDLLTLWCAACLGAMGVAALTLPGLGRPLSADHLRRE